MCTRGLGGGPGGPDHLFAGDYNFFSVFLGDFRPSEGLVTSTPPPFSKSGDFFRTSRGWTPPQPLQNPVHTPTRFMAGMAIIESRDDSRILEMGVGHDRPAVILSKIGFQSQNSWENTVAK